MAYYHDGKTYAVVPNTGNHGYANSYGYGNAQAPAAAAGSSHAAHAAHAHAHAHVPHYSSSAAVTRQPYHSSRDGYHYSRRPQQHADMYARGGARQNSDTAYWYCHRGLRDGHYSGPYLINLHGSCNVCQHIQCVDCPVRQHGERAY